VRRNPDARPPVRAVRCALLSAVCGLLCAGAAHAQLEVTPYVGSYRPLTFLGSGVVLPPSGARDTVRHQTSVTLGMRVTKWWPGRLGFEGRVGYAPSSLWSSGIYGGGPALYPAHVWTSSAEALVRLTPPTARARLHVGGGVGLVGHGGDACHSDTYVGPTTFADGIAGVGAAIELGRWLSVRLDAEDFVYPADLGPCRRTGAAGGVCDVFGRNAGRTTGSRLQDDLVLSLGFALDWGKLLRAGGL